jgi:hypothetical protein
VSTGACFIFSSSATSIDRKFDWHYSINLVKMDYYNTVDTEDSIRGSGELIRSTRSSLDELDGLHLAYDSDSGESYNESRHTNSYSRNINSALRHKKTREREQKKSKKMKKKMAGAGMLVGEPVNAAAIYTRVGAGSSSSYSESENSTVSRIGEISRPNSSRHSLQSVELQSVADGAASRANSRQHALFLSNPHGESGDANASVTGVSPRVRSKHDFVWKEWKSSKYKYYFRTCSFAIVVAHWVMFLSVLSDNVPADTTGLAWLGHMGRVFFTGESISPSVLRDHGAAGHDLLFEHGYLQSDQLWRVFGASWLSANSVELVTVSLLLFFLGGYVSLLIQFTSLFNERRRQQSSSGPNGHASDVTFLNTLAYFNYFVLYIMSSMFGVTMR